MLNESVVSLLESNLWDLATCADGEPNVVPVGFKSVTEDGKLIVGDVFMDTTLRNVKKNGRAAVSVYDLQTSEGYQIKGAAEYVSEGAIVDAFREVAGKISGGGPQIKGAVVITPEKVIVTTPGPDNKKEL